MEKPKAKIKVTKNGPYIVSGKVPLARQIILSDKDGVPEKWKEGEKFPAEKEYELCRCGGSDHKPFCDGSHHRVNFNGKETANKKGYDKCNTINGPNLVLKDNSQLCIGAGFCHRKTGAWNLTQTSDNPENKKMAIQECCNCPSGRLVACEKKTGKPIEPDFKQSIGLIEDKESGISGPVWARGKIPVESADGKQYELRNRMTLCRCGKSKNKPFCDGTHIDINFSDKKKANKA